jgi:hypothetical protein
MNPEKVIVYLTTPTAARLMRKNCDRNMRAQDFGVETYCDQSDRPSVEIQCTTEEREEYERVTRDQITSDVLAPSAFCMFATWLQDNAKLRIFSVKRY